MLDFGQNPLSIRCITSKNIRRGLATPRLHPQPLINHYFYLFSDLDDPHFEHIRLCPTCISTKVNNLIICQADDMYSCHQKSAYTHLHFCGLEHCCASQTDKWTSVTIPSGITHPTLQPPLFRFLQTLARFKTPAQDGISCWQKADAVSSRSQSH